MDLARTIAVFLQKNVLHLRNVLITYAYAYNYIMNIINLNKSQLEKLSIFLSLFITVVCSVDSTSLQPPPSHYEANDNVIQAIAINNLIHGDNNYSSELVKAALQHSNDILGCVDYNDLINNPKENILYHLKANKGLVRRNLESTVSLLGTTTLGLLFFSMPLAIDKAVLGTHGETAFSSKSFTPYTTAKPTLTGALMFISASLFTFKVIINSFNPDLDLFISDLRKETTDIRFGRGDVIDIEKEQSKDIKERERNFAIIKTETKQGATDLEETITELNEISTTNRTCCEVVKKSGELLIKEGINTCYRGGVISICTAMGLMCVGVKSKYVMIFFKHGILEYLLGLCICSGGICILAGGVVCDEISDLTDRDDTDITAGDDEKALCIESPEYINHFKSYEDDNNEIASSFCRTQIRTSCKGMKIISRILFDVGYDAISTGGVIMAVSVIPLLYNGGIKNNYDLYALRIFAYGMAESIAGFSLCLGGSCVEHIREANRWIKKIIWK